MSPTPQSAGADGGMAAGHTDAKDKMNIHSPSSKSLCVGDLISLFVEDLNGFLSADGFTEDSLNVQCLRENEICVPRFESCVFQASPPTRLHVL